MDDSAWRRRRLDIERLFESFESVPKALAPAVDDRYENDVIVVDQISLDELLNRADPATGPDVKVAAKT